MSEHVSIDQYDLYQEYSGLGSVQKSCESVRVEETENPTVVVEHWSHLSKPLMRYQIKNDQDSVSLELDEKGEEISYEEYSAFGTTTYSRSTKDAPKPFRYATKRRDKETGLAYFGGRYYVPWLCRWLSPDPSGLVDGTNTYLYCGANPTNYTDSDGNMMRGMANVANAARRTRPVVNSNHIPTTSMNVQQSARNSNRVLSSAIVPAPERRLTVVQSRSLTIPPPKALTTVPSRDLVPSLQPQSRNRGGNSQGSSSSPQPGTSTQVASTDTESNLALLNALFAGYELGMATAEAMEDREETSTEGETPQKAIEKTIEALVWEIVTRAAIRSLTGKYTIALEGALATKDVALGAKNLAALGGAAFSTLAHEGKDRFAEAYMPEGTTRFSSQAGHGEDAYAAATMKTQADVIGYAGGKAMGMILNTPAKSPTQPSI